MGSDSMHVIINLMILNFSYFYVIAITVVMTVLSVAFALVATSEKHIIIMASLQFGTHAHCLKK